MSADPLLEHTLTSDATGDFEWPLHPPDSTVTVKASASRENHHCYGDTKTVLRGQQAPELKVRLYPLDAVIAGTVTNQENEPLVGVEIRSSYETTTTAEGGTYRTYGSASRTETSLYATHPGYAQYRATANLTEPGQNATVDIQLVPSFQVVGRVVDEQEAPVAAATVRTFSTNKIQVLTAEDGSFRFDHLDPRRDNHHVYARKEGYVEADARIQVEGEVLEIPDLILTRGVRVGGVVLGPNGEALEGASLYIGFSPSAYNRLDARTDADGVFAFPHVPTGAQTLFASYPGLAPVQQVLHLTDEQPLHSGLVIRLGRGHFIGGRTRTEAGEALSEVWISVRHQREYTGQRATSDEEGRFRLEGLPEADVSLEFYRPGLVPRTVPMERLDHEGLDVALQQSAKVAGRVVDGSTGEPIQEFLIRFVRAEDGPWIGGHSATWSREGHRFTNTDGYWNSGDENLRPDGVTAIEARAEGYAVTRLDRVVASVEPNPDDWILRMLPGGTIRGRVLDEVGRAIPGVRLKAFPASVSRRSISGEPYETGQAVSSENGTFEIVSVAPDSTVLLVQAPSRAEYTDGPFDVSAGSMIDRTVVLPAGLTLEGQLAGTDGAPLPAQAINLYASQVEGVERFRASSTTDAQGAFDFEHLPAGLYLSGQPHPAGGRPLGPGPDVVRPR